MSTKDYVRFYAGIFLKQQIKEAADDIANGRVFTFSEVISGEYCESPQKPSLEW